MTNAEKYLKDNVSVEELAKDITKFIADGYPDSFIFPKSIENYFKAECKPTLTEDERVILRNIHKDFTDIRKTKISSILQIWNEYLGEWVGFNEFDRSLFQFIKERRRIRDKGVVKWKRHLNIPTQMEMT